LEKTFPNAVFMENTVSESCVDTSSKYRPDLLIIVDDVHNIIIEIDENEHRDRGVCEEKRRLLCLSQLRRDSCAMTSIVRVNPDTRKPRIFRHIPTRVEGTDFYTRYKTSVIESIVEWAKGIENETLSEWINKVSLDTYTDIVVDECIRLQQKSTSVVTYFGYSETSDHLPGDMYMIERGMDGMVSKRSYCLSDMVCDV
jgi:hypothetical protein